jgi:hypothetical protein
MLGLLSTRTRKIFVLNTYETEIMLVESGEVVFRGSISLYSYLRVELESPPLMSTFSELDPGRSTPLVCSLNQ